MLVRLGEGIHLPRLRIPGILAQVLPSHLVDRASHNLAQGLISAFARQQEFIGAQVAAEERMTSFHLLAQAALGFERQASSFQRSTAYLSLLLLLLPSLYLLRRGAFPKGHDNLRFIDRDIRPQVSASESDHRRKRSRAARAWKLCSAC